MARDYNHAVTLLNTLQTNFAIVDAIRKSGQKLNENAISEMVEWCRRAGYKPSDFNVFSPIHIAGTKGKGSTAAFTSSILMQFIDQDLHGARSFSKVGLYTSPHLRHVRERIQINGAPLTEEQFAQYFFEIWDRLENAAKSAGEDPTATNSKPVYFRYLTLMAFHTYVREKVDVAVIECGIGGAYDSTNIIECPVVTGITSLRIDHVGMLGSTIGEIAWHKAGIMKKGVRCHTHVDQAADAKEVMENVAQEKGALLKYAHTHHDIENGSVPLGLQGDFQKINASLAAKLASTWLFERGYKEETLDYVLKLRKGLQNVRWPGRCDTRYEKRIQWCIDGAHTLESIELAGRWFIGEVSRQIIDQQDGSIRDHESSTIPSDSDSRPAVGPCSIAPITRTRVMIFNQQTRDATALAAGLFRTLSSAVDDDEHPFKFVIFCTNTTYEKTGFAADLVSVNVNASDVEGLTVQRRLAETWSSLDSAAVVKVVRTIEEAVREARNVAAAGNFSDAPALPEQDSVAVQRSIGASAATEPMLSEVSVFVTGSLHLVGGFLEILESNTIASVDQPFPTFVTGSPPLVHG